MSSATVTSRNVRPAPIQALLLGAAASLAALLLYVGLFDIYAIARSSLQILSTLDPGDAVIGTLIANAITIGLASFSTGLLLSLIVAPLGALTMLLAYAAAGPFHARGKPGRAAIVGGGVAALAMLALEVLIWSALGTFREAFWPSSYLFWLGLPSLFFVAAVALASWRSALAVEG